MCDIQFLIDVTYSKFIESNPESKLLTVLNIYLMHKIVRIIDAVVIFKMKYLLDACENKAKYMYSMHFYFL